MKEESSEITPAALSPYSNPGGQITQSMPRTNWAGNVIFGTHRVARPESIDNLRRIVGDNRRIRALGCGHSFSGIVDTAGNLVLLDGSAQMTRHRFGEFHGHGGCRYELHRGGRGVASCGLRTGEYGLDSGHLDRWSLRDRNPRIWR